MASVAGGGGGGGYSSAYGKTGSVYGSQVPKFNQPAKVSKSKPKAKKRPPAVKAPKNSYRPVVQQHGTVRATARNNYSNSRNSSSSGSSNRNRGGYGSGSSGVGSSSTGAVTPKIAKPVVPSETDFLKTDSAYQQQSAALRKALEDYTLQQNQAQTGYETNYASDLNTWGTNQKQALGDLENDYASRGLLQSGLYADSLATTNNDWDQRKSQLELAKQQYLQGLASDRTNFTAQQGLTDTQAKQEAAARRAAKYGLA